ncbi:MAG: SGNH/GDSL hydrolase family protein [Eubacterium sp.]|nr:SGNH/GDSL hydrolase family protein [Eubacterium sp.]
MKKIKPILAAILAAACCISFAACDTAGTESQSTDNSSSSDVSVTDASSTAETSSEVQESSDTNESSDPADESSIPDEEKTEEQIYDEMVERSLMTTGDPGRMAQVINKLENNEEVTVAFLGGSITEGMTAGAELCWAKLTYDYLCEKYPDAKINYVNAGMSGTPSILGNIRLQRDVLDHTPDLVFVEFAVNDGMEQIYKDSYEALVREILQQENDPAVVLYFTVIKSGHTCQSTMAPIGEAYGLPMVSLNNVLKPEFESGRMTWEDYSDDESHPNVWGHAMTRDLIAYMFEKVDEAVKASENTEIAPVPDEWVYGDRFENMQFTDRVYNTDLIKITSTGSFYEKDTLNQFPNGWEIKGSVENMSDPFEFTFTGDNLFMLTLCANSDVYADIQVTVDGEEVGIFPTSSPNGWSNPEQTLIFSGENKEHTVSLKPIAKEGKTAMFANLLGFGITN